MNKWKYITPRQVVNDANLQTDEVFTDEQLGNFFNQCIGDMNVRLGINMPILQLGTYQGDGFTLDKVYTVLPDVFMTSAVQYYVSYAIKAQDSSNNEAELFFQKYLMMIDYMQSMVDSFINYQDPEQGIDNSQYGGISSNGYEYDLTGNPYLDNIGG